MSDENRGFFHPSSLILHPFFSSPAGSEPNGTLLSILLLQSSSEQGALLLLQSGSEHGVLLLLLQSGSEHGVLLLLQSSSGQHGVLLLLHSAHPGAPQQGRSARCSVLLLDRGAGRRGVLLLRTILLAAASALGVSAPRREHECRRHGTENHGGTAAFPGKHASLLKSIQAKSRNGIVRGGAAAGRQARTKSATVSGPRTAPRASASGIRTLQGKIPRDVLVRFKPSGVDLH
jgi:hypothetical protein